MSILEAEMKELLAEYRGDAAQRLADLAGLLEALDRDPGDRGLLDLALRRFHGFVGSGSTHGFPRVTELGRAGESACARWSRGSAPLDGAKRRRLRALAARLAAELVTPAADLRPQ
jgi:chemotaxis protein histidine kinase CheA